MSKPQRIQRKRTKGWKMPENTVYVGRGSKWGNPFKIGEFTQVMHKSSAYPYEMYMDSFKVVGNSHAVQLFKTASDKRADWYHKDYIFPCLEDLKGKNLACWCRLDQPCHADVLLEIANRDGGK